MQGGGGVTRAVPTFPGEGNEWQQPSDRADKQDAKKQNVLAFAPPSGFTLVPQPKDGACLYHTPINKLPLEPQAITVEHMQKHSKDNAPSALMV